MSAADGTLMQCDRCRIPLVYHPGETRSCPCGRAVYALPVCHDCGLVDDQCTCPCDLCGEPFNRCDCEAWIAPGVLPIPRQSWMVLVPCDECGKQTAQNAELPNLCLACDDLGARLP